VRVIRRAGRRSPAGALRSALLVLAGAVLLSVGTGMGLPWAAKAGWHAVTVVTLLALLVGAAVVAFGVAELARSTRGWRRWLAPPVALVITAVLVYTLAIPLAATSPPRVAVGDRTPADVGLGYAEVRMPSREGEVLAGWYLPSRNGAAVVLRHGSGSSRSSVLPQAEVLASHGYGVLMTDARGQGASTGRAMAWGWHGDDDVDAAVTLLSRTPGVEPSRIAVAGLSMGGEEALGAAAGDHRIRAVVAEGATGRSAEDLGWLVPAYGWRGRLTLQLHRAQTALVSALSGSSRPTPLAAAAQRLGSRPVLLIAAGTVDDEELAAHAVRDRAPGSVGVWVVPGSRHTGGLRTARDEWERRVVGFLDEALGP